MVLEVKRETILAAVKDASTLTGLFSNDFSSSASTAFGEKLNEIARKDHPALWSELHRRLSEICGNNVFDEGSEEQIEQCLLVIKCAVFMVDAFIRHQGDTKYTPEALKDVVIYLHDILLELPSIPIQNAICRVCELWWSEERSGKDAVVAQSLMLLLAQSLQDTATTADVKRVYAIRSALSLLDFNDESIEAFKTLLHKCIASSLYLSSAEGIRFLTFLFSLDLSLVSELHACVKNQLPYCKKSITAGYAEVYFKAWKNASGNVLRKIEYECIQDFMHHAVHASTAKLASQLRKVLSIFHSNKQHKGVDEMLSRLYEPILWRALKVANPAVRENAAALLFDVFPIQDPDASRADLDMSLQRQFDQFDALLSDPSWKVRQIAVHGVCRVLGIFWELIPTAVTKAFLLRLAQELAHDSSAFQVRVAVFEGFGYLLENALSQPAMGAVLKQMKLLIHDTNDKVRAAFVDVLLQLRTLRSIRYFDVVPLDHLLGRLAEDHVRAPHVADKLTSLLLNSFFPHTKSASAQMTRVLYLIQQHPMAAVAFLSRVHQFVPLQSLCKLMSLVKTLVTQCANRETNESSGNVIIDLRELLHGAEEDEPVSESTQPARKGKRKMKKSAAKDNQLDIELDNDQQESSTSQVRITNYSLMENLLAGVAVMWESVSDTLQRKENQPLLQQLYASFQGDTLLYLLGVFDSHSACQRTVLRIARQLPPSLLTKVTASVFGRLEKIQTEQETFSAELDGLLDCFVYWKKEDVILDLVFRWLNHARECFETGKSLPAGSTLKSSQIKKKTGKGKTFNAEINDQGASRKRKKDAPNASVDSSSELDACLERLQGSVRPELALAILNQMLNRSEIRDLVFMRQREQFDSIVSALSQYVPLIEQKAVLSSSIRTQLSDDMLSLEACELLLSVYSRLLVHLAAAASMVPEDDTTRESFTPQKKKTRTNASNASSKSATPSLTIPDGLLDLLDWTATSMLPIMFHDCLAVSSIANLATAVLSTVADCAGLAMANSRCSKAVFKLVSYINESLQRSDYSEAMGDAMCTMIPALCKLSYTAFQHAGDAELCESMLSAVLSSCATMVVKSSSNATALPSLPIPILRSALTEIFSLKSKSKSIENVSSILLDTLSEAFKTGCALNESSETVSSSKTSSIFALPSFFSVLLAVCSRYKETRNGLKSLLQREQKSILERSETDMESEDQPSMVLEHQITSLLALLESIQVNTKDVEVLKDLPVDVEGLCAMKEKVGGPSRSSISLAVDSITQRFNGLSAASA